MQIDTRFLEPHPRTVLWLKQRQQCATCRFVDQAVDQGWRCTASPTVRSPSGRLTGRARFIYCIDAREEKGPCGPKARLFQVKNTSEAEV